MKAQCQGCGCEIYDPFTGTKIIHDERACCAQYDEAVFGNHNIIETDSSKGEPMTTCERWMRGDISSAKLGEFYGLTRLESDEICFEINELVRLLRSSVEHLSCLSVKNEAAPRPGCDCCVCVCANECSSTLEKTKNL